MALWHHGGGWMGMVNGRGRNPPFGIGKRPACVLPEDPLLGRILLRETLLEGRILGIELGSHSSLSLGLLGAEGRKSRACGEAPQDGDDRARLRERTGPSGPPRPGLRSGLPTLGGASGCSLQPVSCASSQAGVRAGDMKRGRNPCP